MEMSLDPRQMLRIFLRRKWFFILPAALVLALAIAVLASLPPLYRSQATLLVKGQNVPENVVPSLVTEEIDRRLQFITTQVLSTNNLIQIANRHGLYTDEDPQLSPGRIAGKMRERIETESVVTAFNDSRTGRSGQATLGFQISFVDGDPEVARRITSDLVSEYMAITLETKREFATQTQELLTSERSTLDDRIGAIEDEIAAFKTENRELLPAEADFKRQLLNNLEQNLRTLESDLRVLRERESYLATQLALTNEFDANGNQDSAVSRLETLQAELATARARYSPGHPDVIRLEREVRSLENMVGGGNGAASSSIAEEADALRVELAALRERYTDEHPDVQRVQRELAALERSANANRGGTAANETNRNPAYVQLSAQLNSVRAEIGAIEEQQQALSEERVSLQEQLARAPTVEREYNRLTRRLESAMADRDTLAEKEATVRLSGAIETAPEIGERLTLLEAPTLPSSPSSPSTTLILGLGLVLAIGSGGASLTLAELLDRSLRSAEDLARIVGEKPLVMIPVIPNTADMRRRQLWRFGGLVALMLVVAGVLAVVNARVASLDVLGYQALGIAQDWVADTFPFVGSGGDTGNP
jgi:uncharacterized protein involved in exopolysaccharide biosynthesis